MADEQSQERSRSAKPQDAAVDPQNAANQEQLQRDHDAMQRQADRVEASVPPEVRDRTVGEIVDEAERRADREGRTPDTGTSGRS